MRRFPNPSMNKPLLITMMVSSLLFTIYQISIYVLSGHSRQLLMPVIASVAIGSFIGWACLLYSRLLSDWKISKISSELDEFSLKLFPSLALYIILISVVIAFLGHSETIEWLAYEWSAIYFAAAFLITGFVLNKRSPSGSFYKKSLPLLTAVSLFYLIYTLFIRQHQPVNNRYFLILALIIIPTIDQVRFSGKLSKGFLSKAVVFFRGEQLSRILLFNITGIIGVLAFFNAAIGKAAVVFAFSLLTGIYLYFIRGHLSLKGSFLTRPLKMNRNAAFVLVPLATLAIFWFIQRPVEYFHYGYYLGPVMDVLQGEKPSL